MYGSPAAHRSGADPLGPPAASRNTEEASHEKPTEEDLPTSTSYGISQLDSPNRGSGSADSDKKTAAGAGEPRNRTTSAPVLADLSQRRMQRASSSTNAMAPEESSVRRARRPMVPEDNCEDYIVGESSSVRRRRANQGFMQPTESSMRRFSNGENSARSSARGSVRRVRRGDGDDRSDCDSVASSVRRSARLAHRRRMDAEYERSPSANAHARAAAEEVPDTPPSPPLLSPPQPAVSTPRGAVRSTRGPNGAAAPRRARATATTVVARQPNPLSGRGRSGSGGGRWPGGSPGASGGPSSATTVTVSDDDDRCLNATALSASISPTTCETHSANSPSHYAAAQQSGGPGALGSTQSHRLVEDGPEPAALFPEVRKRQAGSTREHSSDYDSTSISELKRRAADEEGRRGQAPTASDVYVPPLPLSDITARRDRELGGTATYQLPGVMYTAGGGTTNRSASSFAGSGRGARTAPGEFDPAALTNTDYANITVSPMSEDASSLPTVSARKKPLHSARGSANTSSAAPLTPVNPSPMTLAVPSSSPGAASGSSPGPARQGTAASLDTTFSSLTPSMTPQRHGNSNRQTPLSSAPAPAATAAASAPASSTAQQSVKVDAKSSTKARPAPSVSPSVDRPPSQVGTARPTPTTAAAEPVATDDAAGLHRRTRGFDRPTAEKPSDATPKTSDASKKDEKAKQKGCCAVM